MRTNNDNFTKEDAIKIQRDQLDQWAKILKPEVFAKLEAHAIADNDHVSISNPFEIFRGTRIDNYLHNEFMNNQP